CHSNGSRGTTRRWRRARTEGVPFAMELKGRIALVTGSGHRVGRAIAVALAGEGMHVAVHYHEAGDGAKETEAQIRGAGVRVGVFAGDLGDPAQPALLVERVTN